MIRFSFKVQEKDAEQLYELLRKIEVDNLKTEHDNHVSPREIESALKGLADIEKGRSCSSREVRNAAKKICGL